MTAVNNSKDERSVISEYTNKTPKAVDGGWGWLVVLSSFIHNCLTSSVCFTFGIFYKDIQAAFDDGSAKTQLLNSVIVGVAYCTGPVSGALINRYDCRRVAIAGGVIFSLGLFLSTFSPNLDVMILLYGVVGGFGIGLVYTTSLVIISYYFVKRRALATGIATSGSGVWSFVSAPVYEILLDTYGWRGAIWIVSGIVLHCVIFAILYRPHPVQGCGLSSTGGDGMLHDENNGNKAKIYDTKEKLKIHASLCLEKITKCAQVLDISLFTNTAFGLFLLSSSLVAMGSQVPYNFLPALVLDKGLSESEGALLISVLAITKTLSMIMAGLVVDYPWADSILIYSLTLIAGGVATFFLPSFNDFNSLVICCVVLGIPFGRYDPVSTYDYHAGVPEPGKIVQRVWVINIFYGNINYNWTPIAGVLEDVTGGYSAAFSFAGATFILSGITCIPVRLIIRCSIRRSQAVVTTVGVGEITHM